MENKKKMIFNVLFLFLVFAATLYGVFHGEDLSEIAEILKTVNLYWLFPGVVCVIIFQLYHAIRNRRTAGADLLYEERENSNSGINTCADDCHDYI